MSLLVKPISSEVTSALNVAEPASRTTPIIPANSQVRAKVASSTGGDNITISVFYHTY